MYYKNKCLSLHIERAICNIAIKTMDSNPISDKHRLFAYCVTDGLLDEISPEQRASIIGVIESLLSEGEDAISESLLSGEDASAYSKKNFFLPERTNQSLSKLTARNDRSK